MEFGKALGTKDTKLLAKLLGISVAVLAVCAVLYAFFGPVHDAARPPGVFKYLALSKDRPVLSNIAFVDGKDQKVTLADYKGRWVVLNLWATWCTPCVGELPSLAKLKAALPADRMTVLAVDLEKLEGAKVEEFLAGHQAESLGVYVDRPLAMMRTFGAFGLPMTVIVDPEGREYARAEGPEEWADPAAVAYLAELASTKS